MLILTVFQKMQNNIQHKTLHEILEMALILGLIPYVSRVRLPCSAYIQNRMATGFAVFSCCKNMFFHVLNML